MNKLTNFFNNPKVQSKITYFATFAVTALAVLLCFPGHWHDESAPKKPRSLYK